MPDSHRALLDYLLYEQVMRWQPILREQARLADNGGAESR